MTISKVSSACHTYGQLLEALIEAAFCAGACRLWACLGQASLPDLASCRASGLCWLLRSLGWQQGWDLPSWGTQGAVGLPFKPNGAAVSVERVMLVATEAAKWSICPPCPTLRSLGLIVPAAFFSQSCPSSGLPSACSWRLSCLATRMMPSESVGSPLLAPKKWRPRADMQASLLHR